MVVPQHGAFVNRLFSLNRVSRNKHDRGRQAGARRATDYSGLMAPPPTPFPSCESYRDGPSADQAERQFSQRVMHKAFSPQRQSKEKPQETATFGNNLTYVWRFDSDFLKSFAFRFACSIERVLTRRQRVSREARALVQGLQVGLVPSLLLRLIGGLRMRSGEIVFYLLAGTMALAVALQPRSLLAAALFVAITAIALAVALES
jgi:hypothetical protein